MQLWLNSETKRPTFVPSTSRASSHSQSLTLRSICFGQVQPHKGDSASLGDYSNQS